MGFFDLGAKWRGLLLTAMMGALLFGGLFFLPDAEAQGEQGTGSIRVSLFGPSGQDFPVTTTGGLDPSSFDLANGNLVAFGDLGPGTYGFELTPPPGFGGSISCTDSEDVVVSGLSAQITIQPNQEGPSFSCQYQMVQFAVSITIVKDVVPDGIDAFDFTTTGFGLESFTLDDDGDSEPFSDRIRFVGLTPGDYSVTETAVPGYGTEITCPSLGAVTTSIDDNTVNFTIVDGQSTSITCTYTNTTVTVCATKSVGFVASELGGFTADDFPFSMQSAMAPVEPLEVESCEGTAFNVAPGAQYQLSETISPEDAPFVGFVSGECRAGESDPEQILNGTITTTAPEQGGQINCNFVNDSISVCVHKVVTSDALEAGFEPEDFSFQLNGGPAVAAGGQGCSEGASVEFLVAPGSTSTITEVISESHVARPVFITCSQQQVQGEAQTIGTANLADESIVIETSASNTAPIFCTFINDVLIVCVTKSLSREANVIADPGDFTIDLLVSGQEPETLVPRSFNRLCGEVEGSSVGIDGTSLAPGTEFSLTERDPGPRIGLTDAVCSTGDSEFNLDEGGTRTISGISQAQDTNRINCEFVNGSVVVCVTKQFGPDVAEAGIAPSPGMFAVTVNGQTVVEAATPALGSEGDLCANGESLRFGFNAAPGATITLTETLPDGSPLRLVDVDCGFEAEGPVDLPTTLDGQTATFTLLSQDPVECTVTNDVAIICVQKQIGEAAFFIAGARAADFTFTVSADGDPAVELSEACFPSDGGNSLSEAAFAVPPGSTVTVTENASDSVADVVAVSCVAGESDIAGDVDTRSVMVDLADREFVRCQFINDVVTLCVIKQIGPNAQSMGLSASDFGFTVESNGVTPVPSDFRCSMDSADATQFALAPAAGFTATESALTTTSVPSGLVSVTCTGSPATPVVDLAAGSVTIAGDRSVTRVECVFTNETAVVCVVKRLDSGAVAAGYELSDFSFQLQVDGELVGAAVVPAPATDDANCTSDQEGAGVATLVAAPGTSYAVTEIIGDGVRADVGSATCESTRSFGERTVAFTPDITSDDEVSNPYSHDCGFHNLSIPITINKTVINDNAGTLTVADFIFDVFDGDGELIASVSDPDAGSAGAIVHVAPYTTFTITERAVEGYETTSAVCTQTGFDQALAATSVTYELGEFELSTECVFVNDDIPPIPVCAMLILEEGDSGFTLADFSLELFKDGAIVGQSTADGEFDATCEDQTDNSASLLPSALVKLGDVFANGSSFSFVAGVADPDGLLEFEPSSCTVDSPAVLQALSGPDAVEFTAEVGATRVLCIARANALPPVAVTGISGSRPTFVEEQPVTAVQPVAAVVPTQVVSTAIAVTGSNTTDTTLPVAFALLAAGFAGLGTDRLRRRRFDGG